MHVGIGLLKQYCFQSMWIGSMGSKKKKIMTKQKAEEMTLPVQRKNRNSYLLQNFRRKKMKKKLFVFETI